MSLEELLKDPESSSRWKSQRAKLLRILTGTAVVAVALAVIAFSFFSDKSQQQAKDAAEDEANAQTLAQLIRTQEEAKKLKTEIDQLRQTASTASPHQALPKRSLPDRPQIINFDPGTGFNSVTPPEAERYIPTGAVFQARLITPIKTSVERTFVLAETTHEFRMDMKRRIPKGSRLIGRARLNPILKGVVVEFDQLVLPNGIETTMSGLALSRNALPEIDGLYFSDHLQNYGAALAFGFLSGFADAARVRESTFFSPQPQESLSNQVLAGLSTASFQVAEDILRDIRTRAIEYVVVPAGEPVFVALTRRYDISSGAVR